MASSLSLGSSNAWSSYQTAPSLKRSNMAEQCYYSELDIGIRTKGTAISNHYHLIHPLIMHLYKYIPRFHGKPSPFRLNQDPVSTTPCSGARNSLKFLITTEVDPDQQIHASTQAFMIQGNLQPLRSTDPSLGTCDSGESRLNGINRSTASYLGACKSTTT